MTISKDVLKVLELAERYTPESDVPPKLKDAVHFCIAHELVCIQPADPVKIPRPDGSVGLFPERCTLLPPPHPPFVRHRLLLKEDGEKALASARQGAEPNAADQTQTPQKKSGRKSNEKGDKKIAEDYHKGLEAGEWEGQADYLRKKHGDRYSKNPSATRAWLSTLLKRVEKRTSS